jgi:predicted AlkP superfamily phosphohydrolase/phosphomutase
MGTKLLVIGIDALDAGQIAKYEHVLPNLQRLRKSCPEISLNSVCPPDSDTAWATIYTGINPARHGIVQYVDPLEKSISYVSTDMDNGPIRGKTYWDLASTVGKRVCVLFPHLGYPVWPVHGVMVGRSSIENRVESHPSSIASQYDLSKMNVVEGMPGRRKRAYIRANERLLHAQAEFALEMLWVEDWDLFFVYSSVLDMIKHYFWNYCDETDPSYPGDNPLQDTIMNAYVLHDRMIGRLFEAVELNTPSIILSDHGHGMRPIDVLNVNEYLKRKGYLVLKDDTVGRSVSHLLDASKEFALRLVSRFGLGTMASKLLTLMPWARSLYTSPLSIDWTRTAAFATNLSGLKAYAYSGIVIRRDRLAQSYETVREEIIKDLSAIRDAKTEEAVVEWVRRREELYAGPHIEKYPDIVFELRQGFGVGLTAGSTLFGRSPSRGLVPGSHTSSGAVFLIHNAKRSVQRHEMDLVDVAPTILDCLGVPVPKDMEGNTIFKT